MLACWEWWESAACLVGWRQPKAVFVAEEALAVNDEEGSCLFVSREDAACVWGDGAQSDEKAEKDDAHLGSQCFLDEWSSPPFPL
jgi:hypothetical protein